MNSSFSKKGPEVQAAGPALRRRKLPEPSAPPGYYAGSLSSLFENIWKK